MANITTTSASATPPTPPAAPQYNNPRRFEIDQENREFLAFLEKCEARSKANPRKVINVAPGFVFLTLEDGNTWSIVHDRAAREWVAYVGNFLEADPKKTKREMVASLLA
jgi:hypothetical protein